jgi:hypothetical protein
LNLAVHCNLPNGLELPSQNVNRKFFHDLRTSANPPSARIQFADPYSPVHERQINRRHNSLPSSKMSADIRSSEDPPAANTSTADTSAPVFGPPTAKELYFYIKAQHTFEEAECATLKAECIELKSTYVTAKANGVGYAEKESLREDYIAHLERRNAVGAECVKLAEQWLHVAREAKVYNDMVKEEKIKRKEEAEKLKEAPVFGPRTAIEVLSELEALSLGNEEKRLALETTSADLESKYNAAVANNSGDTEVNRHKKRFVARLRLENFLMKEYMSLSKDQQHMHREVQLYYSRVTAMKKEQHEEWIEEKKKKLRRVEAELKLEKQRIKYLKAAKRKGYPMTYPNWI